MKRIAFLIIAVVTIGLSPGAVSAQRTAPAHMGKVTEAGNTIEFTLTSAKPFIFGNNRYVLHIGDKVFFRNRQSYDESTLEGTLTFMIDKSDFNALESGKGIYLTYGYADENEQALEEFTKNNFPACWALGKFSKDMLSK